MAQKAQSSSVLLGILRQVVRPFEELTRPHPDITGVEDRRNARLSGVIILVAEIVIIFALLGLMISDAESRDDADFIASSIAWFLGLVPLALARSRNWRLANLLFVLIVTAVTVLAPFMETSSQLFIAYVFLPLLMVGVFQPFRWAVVFNILVLVIIAVLIHVLEYWGSNVGWIALVLFSVLFLTFMRHVRNIEAIRRKELEKANTLLRQSEIQLEQRVKERTRDLEVAAQVSKQVVTMLDLAELLPNLVESTRKGFDLYHVSVFLYDPESKLLTYEAGTGDPGRQLKAENKQFHLDDRPGMVPHAARTLSAVVSNDVAQEERHLKNSHLPDTRSEAALPMVVGSRLIGVLDLQSEQLDRFGPDDLRAILSLAEQFAIAVQNATLYAQQVEIADNLRELDSVKSQFLASMSHELRTPLNAILNFTEFVSLGILGPVNEKQQDALSKALDSGRHLLSLINDVLDVTKIQAGLMNLFIEENIDVRQELAPIVATAHSLLEGKPVTFVQDIDDPLPCVKGDRRRIRQILLNLISNAAKFTEEGRVTLSARNCGDEILFTVSDTGPGIAAEHQSVIFEPFIQTETGIKHAGGTGLGLPISKHLAEVHGGRLWVESKPGEGASFYFVLPVNSRIEDTETVISEKVGHA